MMEAESQLRDLTLDFSVEVLKMCDSIEVHLSITNQLERSATSVGANIQVANYAQSKADFVANLQIALKECYETEYWLELFVKAELLDRENAKKIYNDCKLTHCNFRLTMLELYQLERVVTNYLYHNIPQHTTTIFR